MSATGYFFFGSDTERSTLTIESKNCLGPKISSFFFVDRLIGQKLSCLKKCRPCRGFGPLYYSGEDTRPHGATSRPPAERRALHTDGRARALGATQRRKKGVPFVVSNLLIALFFPGGKTLSCPRTVHTDGWRTLRASGVQPGWSCVHHRSAPAFFSCVVLCFTRARGAVLSDRVHISCASSHHRIT